MKWSDISFTPRVLRQFAALWILFFGGLGLWRGLVHGQTTLGIALVIVALTVGPLGLWRPQWIRPVYKAWMAAVFPIGWTVSLVTMAVVYYAVVTPLAVLMRLAGRDALDRQAPPVGETYWRPKPAPKDSARYLRQY